ncbi:MAG: alpha/beta hydrolase [Stappiaceae bacterium]
MKNYRHTTFTRDNLPLSTYVAAAGSLPIVFQHGLCGDAAQPADVIPSDAVLKHYVMECRGHGRSPIGPADDISIAKFTDDLAAFMAAEHLPPCPVGGISMGAAIALRLAVIHPERVSHLVLARPAWTTESAPENMAPNAEVGRLLSLRDPQSACNAFVETATAKKLRRDAPENLNSLLRFFDRPAPSETAALLTRISSDGPGVSEIQIASLSLPVLILGTADDAIHPMSHAQFLASAIPGAHMKQITSKTADPEAHRAEFQAELSAFLKDYS